MKIDQRLKPGKRQYTFYNGCGVSMLKSKDHRNECEGF